ncbi:hypothetical protein [Litchfieldella xinjiangensis]|uniref:hypothetical protein n=1 Tax=Litchfieldella xinjiangensis TaxID=1166948 RepID=UPI0005BE330E|nr:hypothetical protein [Halomonas xinjiangensis]
MAIGGLLAGAMAGGGKAVQWTAMSAIEQKRQEALRQLDHTLSMEKQNDQQQFQTQERLGGQEFTSGENRANRQHDTQLTQMRESGADRRTGMQLSSADRRANAGGWQLVPTEDGGVVRYNTITGETSEAPQGLLTSAMGNGGKMTDREKARFEMLKDQAETLRNKQADGFELTTEEKARLGQIEADMNGMLGGSAPSLADALEQALAGEGGEAAPDAEDPAPSGADARGLLSQEQRQAEMQQYASEHKRTVDAQLEQAGAVLDSLDSQRSGGARGDLMRGINQARYGGDLEPDAQTLEQGQALADQLMQLHDDPQTSDFQRKQIMDQLRRLRDSGISLTIE